MENIKLLKILKNNETCQIISLEKSSIRSFEEDPLQRKLSKEKISSLNKEGILGNTILTQVTLASGEILLVIETLERLKKYCDNFILLILDEQYHGRKTSIYVNPKYIIELNKNNENGSVIQLENAKSRLYTVEKVENILDQFR